MRTRASALVLRRSSMRMQRCAPPSGEGLNSSAHMLRCVHVHACKHSTYPARATCKRTRAGAQGFRPCERSPCEPLGEVLLNPTGPRRSLTPMDPSARKPWGIPAVCLVARIARTRFACARVAKSSPRSRARASVRAPTPMCAPKRCRYTARVKRTCARVARGSTRNRCARSRAQLFWSIAQVHRNSPLVHLMREHAQAASAFSPPTCGAARRRATRGVGAATAWPLAQLGAVIGCEERAHRCASCWANHRTDQHASGWLPDCRARFRSSHAEVWKDASLRSRRPTMCPHDRHRKRAEASRGA